MNAMILQSMNQHVEAHHWPWGQGFSTAYTIVVICNAILKQVGVASLEMSSRLEQMIMA